MSPATEPRTPTESVVALGKDLIIKGGVNHEKVLAVMKKRLPVARQLHRHYTDKSRSSGRGDSDTTSFKHGGEDQLSL